MRMDFNELIISKEQVEFLHEQTIELLEKKGVLFEHDGAVEIFKKNGFKTDGNIVFFNNKQVQAALELCPQTFDWEARDYTATVDGSTQTLCGSCAGPSYISDSNNTVRRGTLEDYINIAKIVDTSDALQFTHSLLVDTGDVPLSRRPYVQVANLLKYVNKPINLTAIQTANDSAGTVAKKQIQMIKQFYGKESNVVIGGACPISPMGYGHTDIDVLFGYLSEKQPVMIIAMSIAGLTSHASIASTIIQNNAEVLAGIVLTQLVQPKTPVVYATVSTSVNLKTASPLLGSAEVGLMGAATSSLAKYYKIPFRTNGSLSDTVPLDFQAGVESAYTVATTIFSDCDVMQFACGSLGTINITSLEKYLLDEQNVKMALRIKKGIGIDTNKSYIDSILQIEHRGHFMKGRTPKEYRQEHFIPEIFTKVDYNIWRDKNGKTLVQNATEAVEARLNSYQDKELDSAQMNIIKDFLN